MKTITLEQLIAGAILRFESIDKEDIKLLIEELKNNRIIINNENKELYIKEYITFKDGVYRFRDGINKDTLIAENYSVEKEFQNVATTVVLNVLFNMDIDLFTLKKIRNLNNKKEAKSHFNAREQRSIIGLVQNNLISVSWKNLSVLDEDQIYTLTKRGEVVLFMSENKEKMEELYRLFERMRYSTKLIPEFLETTDLNAFKVGVETLIDFEAFCSHYGENSKEFRSL